MDNNTKSSSDGSSQIAYSESEIKLRNAHAESKLDRFLRAHVGQIAVALAIFSAIRILIFCVAFPLGNPTDERFHLMTIRMYAEGHLPGKDLSTVEPEFVRTFLLYWSPEYNLSQQTMDRAGVSGPLYSLTPEARDLALHKDFYRKKLAQWLSRPNFESQSAPLYYVVCAAWYRLGEALGLQDWRLDYWLRFLNPMAYALLVWFSYLFVREVYPERVFLQVAVPAILAVFPQDIFFGINRDVFSAPLAAAAMWLMMRAVNAKPGRNGALMLASFLVGLSFVSNVSNFALYGTLAATLWVWWRGTPTVGRKLPAAIASLVAAGLLPLLWMARNYRVMGDPTGGKAKTHELGWTVKPMAEMFHHPLFSLHGMRYFLTELTRSFWHGELVWHGLPMRSVWTDRFYILSSAIFLGLFVLNFVLRSRAISPLQKLAGCEALFLMAGSILFLAALSLPFDFHDCAYPSRLFPFFVSGRIISGALLPFALIYASGLEWITDRIRKWIPPTAVLACLLLFITVSEIQVRKPAFSSPYNFFALSAWRR